MDLGNLPKLATDAVAIRVSEDGSPEVGIIQRPTGANAGKLSLPGVLVLSGETVKDASLRALSKLTSVDSDSAEYLGTLTFAEDPDRDPRGDTRSLPILWVVSDGIEQEFYPLRPLPVLAFDHNKIVSGARGFLLDNFFNVQNLRLLLGDTFTTGHARTLYKGIAGYSMDAGNFNRELRRIATGKAAGRTTVWTL